MLRDNSYVAIVSNFQMNRRYGCQHHEFNIDILGERYDGA